MVGLPESVVAEPPRGAAVYFLCNGEEVVYVGKSIHPRLRSSLHTDKEHTHVCFLPVERERALEVERHWIKTLKPRHNKKCHPDYKAPRRNRYGVKSSSLNLPNHIRRALNIWAAKTGRKREEWVEEMVRKHLPKELAEAETAIKAEKKRETDSE